MPQRVRMDVITVVHLEVGLPVSLESFEKIQHVNAVLLCCISNLLVHFRPSVVVELIKNRKESQDDRDFPGLG